MSIRLSFVPLAAAALLLSACSSTLIGERLGADQIVVAEATQVGQCKSLGRTTVSVLATLGPITRGNETVEENLVQMARNEAVSKGGDTVVKGNSLEYGKRSFELFRCK